MPNAHNLIDILMHVCVDVNDIPTGDKIILGSRTPSTATAYVPSVHEFETSSEHLVVYFSFCQDTLLLKSGPANARPARSGAMPVT